MNLMHIAGLPHTKVSSVVFDMHQASIAFYTFFSHNFMASPVMHGDGFGLSGVMPAGMTMFVFPG